MSRVTLVHWNATEAEERAERLRRAGHATACFRPQDGPAALRALRDSPPDAVVVDLGRLPAQGRDLAVMLRRRQATRRVPIVFVGGDPGKVTRIRKLLPDAVYTDWSEIAGALAQALANPPAAPVAPGIFDGYAGTPLPRKLGIKTGSVVALLGAPADFEQQLDPLPEKVRLKRQARGPADVILLFAKSRAELERRFPAAVRALAEGGGLWLVWPKKASGIASDLNQNAVRAFGLEAGLVDYKISRIDATWSGLLFTQRRTRPASRGSGKESSR